MRKAWWYWAILALVAWQFVTTAIHAFAVPWSWTGDQLQILFYGFCICIVLGMWGFVWMRGGTAAVKARWSQRGQVLDAARSKKVFRWSLVFWIVVALGLVFIFDIMGRLKAEMCLLNNRPGF
jgi:hypothetical protein